MFQRSERYCRYDFAFVPYTDFNAGGELHFVMTNQKPDA